jgi:diguanylate cyclase (GGDEF)-like protein
MVISLVFLAVIPTFFHIIVPRYGLTQRVGLAGFTLSISLISAYSYLLEPHGVYFRIFYITVVAALGVFGGARLARLGAIIATLAYLLSQYLSYGFSADTILVISIQSFLLLAAAIITGEFTGFLHGKIRHSERRNRYLSILLKAATISKRPDDLRANLSKIAELVVHEVPVTFCKFCLLDKSQSSLSLYGAYPTRSLPGWQTAWDQDFPLEQLTLVSQVLASQKSLVLQAEELQSALSDQDQVCTFVDSMQSICILPLLPRDKPLGVMVVGEARKWERAPFEQEKLDLLNTLAMQVSASIYSFQIFIEAQIRADQLSMLNEVSRAIGSTIDLDALLELIYQQLRNVIISDTYFVALYHEESNVQDIRILIDQGKRYPPQKLPLEQGLASWVILNRQPLLIRNLENESDALPTKPVAIGNMRLSVSWMGVPMLHGSQVLGILALASYSANSFSKDDIDLLENVAAQASLAIMNARQYAGVQEEARRDSLTGAYNHGFFQKLLDKEIERAVEIAMPLALVMVDIDHFKEYNDSHGHLVGDEILRQLVLTIQAAIKKSDFIGRWGGEEFIVALPGATLEQCIQIAMRFRNALEQIQVHNIQGQEVEIPTISQGIACYPQDGQNSIELINSADQALLKAKRSGRDRIVLASENIL